jgi:hypothetical protein
MTSNRLTDDHGKSILPQFRTIERIGDWELLYDQHQIGNTVQHVFRVHKLNKCVATYPGISLDSAKKLFAEYVEYSMQALSNSKGN